MKANITYQKSLFDDSPKSIVIYGKSRESILSVCFAMGKEMLLTNVYITEDKADGKSEPIQNFDNK